MDKFPKTNEFIDFITKKICETSSRIKGYWGYELKEKITDKLIEKNLDIVQLAKEELFADKEIQKLQLQKEILDKQIKLKETELALEQEMQLKALAKAEEWHQQALAEKDQQIAELQARLERFENKND